MATEQDIQEWNEAFAAAEASIQRNRENPLSLLMLKADLEGFYYHIEEVIPLADSWNEKQILFNLQSRTNRAIEACDRFVYEG